MPPLEPFLPLPGPADRIPLATQFRSTWLSSSVRALRARSLLDRYLDELPPQFHEPVLTSVVGVWLPIDVAIAHYAACDALHLASPELFEIGRETASQVHATVLSIAVRLAKGAGATPWTILGQLQRLWERIWIGGAVGAMKAGPKEAIVECVGWPCARFGYTRTAMRGVFAGLCELVSTRVYVTEMSRQCSPTRLTYRIAWA
jgi:hypothetical protein